MRSLHIDTARSWRGGQNQVRLTVDGLVARGHAVCLVAHGAGVLRHRVADPATVRTFEPRSEFDVQAAWALGTAIDDFKPDIIHAHDPKAVALTAMSLQMRTSRPRRPRVVAARRVDFHLKRHAFSRWKYRQVDAFIAASRLIASLLEHDGIPPSRIAVVHDGVDVAATDAIPATDAHSAFWLPHGAPIVGNVAALAPHKGQRHLVAAARLVVREVPDARFLILGEGELHDALAHQIKALGLTHHVCLTGFRPDAIGLMKSFDLFVMSSLTEGLGSAMLEAMACRLAIVGTRTGGIPEAVAHERTGLLVPPAHDAELASAIVRLLQDPATRGRYGEAGRARVAREFSVGELVDGTLAVYTAVLGTQEAPGLAP